jgi:putative isomerase
MMPSKVQYVGIWNWDACFHALAFRHLDPELQPLCLSDRNVIP